MRELNTIQKIGKLNRVFAMDDTGSEGANHCYAVLLENVPDCQEGFLIYLPFQNGSRMDGDSGHGVTDADLLEVVRDRLRGFQYGGFAADYGAEALRHIEIALMYMDRPVMERYGGKTGDMPGISSRKGGNGGNFK